MDIYNTILLVAAALLPAIVLCSYVYKKDRVEKEPIGLLLKLLLFGVFSCIPVAMVENSVIECIDKSFGVFGLDASAVLSRTDFYVYNSTVYFIGVALIEELGKYLFLVLGTKKNKAFNNFFDGLIYSVFVSLGFAALENVMYVTQYGFGVAVSRALLSVPGHMFFAVMMGYYYSLGKIADRANEFEKILISERPAVNAVNRISSKKYSVYSILVPTLAHGLYDFCCTVGEAWATVALLAFVVFMYIKCFGQIKKMSKFDAPIDGYAKSMLIKKYPMHKDFILERF